MRISEGMEHKLRSQEPGARSQNNPDARYKVQGEMLNKTHICTSSLLPACPEPVEGLPANTGPVPGAVPLWGISKPRSSPAQRDLRRNSIQITSVHWETGHCHSESFDRLRTGSAKRGTVILSPALGGTKDLEILRRCAPQNDTRNVGLRMDAD
jgi:hypothetical protein